MSEERGHFLPLWLRENFVLFGAVALALVVFVGTLAYMVGKPEEVRTETPRNVFQDLKVELGDRGTVDLQAKSLAITLRFSGLAQDAAQHMKVKVAIDGREAQVSEPVEGQEVQASVLLQEKVENLVKSNGVGAVLLVKGVCEYGGASAPFDVSATRLQVVSKTWKELGLAFANFPELTPTPTPRVKPTPTPTLTPTPSSSPLESLTLPPIRNPTPATRSTPSATPMASPTQRPRQIFKSPTPPPQITGRLGSGTSSTNSPADGKRFLDSVKKIKGIGRKAEEIPRTRNRNNEPFKPKQF